jgi:hypothetical protein
MHSSPGGARFAAAALLLVSAAAGCQRDPRGGELHATRVVLAREVEGLRAIANRAARGEAILAPDDVVVVIKDSLVRDLLTANLPFEAQVDKYQISLQRAEVTFRGSPLIALEGSVKPREGMDVEGTVRVLGALEKIRIDPASGQLSASVAVDHVDIKRLAGFESFLPGAGLDEVARMVRVQLKDRIPDLAIPVKVEPQIAFPEVTSGPVRLEGATIPLSIGVSDVVAGSGRLWITITLKPGDITKTADAAKPAADAKAEGAR